MEQYTSESQRLSKLQALSNELSHNSIFRLDDEDVKMVTKRWNELNERVSKFNYYDPLPRFYYTTHRVLFCVLCHLLTTNF